MTDRVDKNAMACDKPRRTPGHPKKSHIVKACYDGQEKIIRFGEQGAVTAGKPKAGESQAMKSKRERFKSRHGKNIAKGKSSAAYWADKVKWADGGFVNMRRGGFPELPLPPIPPLTAVRARQAQEFDPVAAEIAEARRSVRRQPLPLPPIPPAVIPPPQAEGTAEAGTPPGFAGETAGDVIPQTLARRLPPDSPWVAEAIKIAERYDLPRDVFLSLVSQESNFNPEARSRVGAYGLTQLMPGTARDLRADRYDPAQNLEAGGRYLRMQLNRFGSLPLALAAYNAGPDRVMRAGNRVPEIAETQDYVAKIMRRAGIPGYAEGGSVGAEPLLDMEDRYADRPTVRADDDYERRLLARDPFAAPVSRMGVSGVPVPRGGREAFPGNAVSPFEAAMGLFPTMEDVQRGMMSGLIGVDIPEGGRVVQTDVTRSGYAIETPDGRLIDPEGRQGRDVREFAGTTRRSAVLPVSQDVETGETSLGVPAALDVLPMAGVQGGPAGALGAGRTRRPPRVNYELPEVDFDPNPRAVIGGNEPPTGRGVLMATGEARRGKPATGGLREAIPVPDVPGAAPDRSPGTVIRHNPSRGDSARFADFQSRIENEPTLLDEIMTTAREGEDIGRAWYNTEATRQRFVDALGDKAGHDAWAEFMYRMGGASPGNAVYPNIRQASYYYAEPKEARAARQAEFEATKKYPRPPEPYGSLTQQYQATLNDLIDRQNFLGNIEPTRAPKPRGFANSLMGNPENIAADKHFMRFIGMASGDPRFLHGSAVISQELAGEIAERFPEIARENIKTREVKDATGKKVMQTSFNAARAVRDNGGANSELFEFIRNRPTVWDEVPRDNEYGAYERLALDIANRMNMTPAQLQASLWMGAARRTGVRESSLDTFDNIFNRVVQDRAAERGLDPAEVFRLFVNRMQPLAVPGAIGAGAAAGIEGDGQ